MSQDCLNYTFTGLARRGKHVSVCAKEASERALSFVCISFSGGFNTITIPRSACTFIGERITRLLLDETKTHMLAGLQLLGTYAPARNLDYLCRILSRSLSRRLASVCTRSLEASSMQ